MKNETDITDSGLSYFPVNISCGNCSGSNEETETKLFDLKRKSARLASRMEAGGRNLSKSKLLMDSVAYGTDSSSDIEFEDVKESVIYKCPKCKYSWTSPECFWSHIKDCLTDEQTFIDRCCFCPKRLKTAKSLFAHIKRVHCIRKCMSCSVLVSQIETESHCSIHVSSYGSECFACDFQPNSAAGLAKHISDRHFESTQRLDLNVIPNSTGSYSCTFCDHCTTQQISYLRKHYVDHHTSESSLNNAGMNHRHEDHLPTEFDTSTSSNSPRVSFSPSEKGLPPNSKNSHKRNTNIHFEQVDKDKRTVVKTPPFPTLTTNALAGGSRLLNSKSQIYGLKDAVPSFASAREFECPICNNHSSTSPDELRSHIKHCKFDTHWTASKDRVQCCFCPTKLQNAGRLLKHIDTSHCVLKCLFCSSLVSQVASHSHYLNHMSGLNEMKCFACNFTASHSMQLGKHIRGRHFRSTRKVDFRSIPNTGGCYSCTSCGQFDTTAISYMKKHYVTHHRNSSSPPHVSLVNHPSKEDQL